VRESEGIAGGKSKHFLPYFGLGLGWFFYLVSELSASEQSEQRV